MAAGSLSICSANETPLTRSNTIPQRPSICCTLQTAGTGSPKASTAALIAASRNITCFEPVDRQSFTTRQPHSNTSALCPAASRRPMVSLIVHPLPSLLKNHRPHAGAKPSELSSSGSSGNRTARISPIGVLSKVRHGSACPVDGRTAITAVRHILCFTMRTALYVFVFGRWARSGTRKGTMPCDIRIRYFTPC